MSTLTWILSFGLASALAAQPPARQLEARLSAAKADMRRGSRLEGRRKELRREVLLAHAALEREVLDREAKLGLQIAEFRRQEVYRTLVLVDLLRLAFRDGELEPHSGVLSPKRRAAAAASFLEQLRAPLKARKPAEQESLVKERLAQLAPALEAKLREHHEFEEQRATLIQAALSSSKNPVMPKGGPLLEIDSQLELLLQEEGSLRALLSEAPARPAKPDPSDLKVVAAVERIFDAPAPKAPARPEASPAPGGG